MEERFEWKTENLTRIDDRQGHGKILAIPSDLFDGAG
jgi:hypothetical protein